MQKAPQIYEIFSNHPALPSLKYINQVYHSTPVRIKQHEQQITQDNRTIFVEAWDMVSCGRRPKGGHLDNPQ